MYPRILSEATGATRRYSLDALILLYVCTWGGGATLPHPLALKYLLTSSFVAEFLLGYLTEVGVWRFFIPSVVCDRRRRFKGRQLKENVSCLLLHVQVILVSRPASVSH